MTGDRWCDFDALAAEVTAQFQPSKNSIHGISHWQRVEQNGIRLCERSGADVFVVRLFAWFHDSKRINDFIDRQHGLRGAEYAKLLRGKFFQIEDAGFEKLTYACQWHTDKRHSADITIGTCWDADRLDLTRIGVVPSEIYMSTPCGKEIARTGSLESGFPVDLENQHG
jgi:uncharacterized protein